MDTTISSVGGAGRLVPADRGLAAADGALFSDRLTTGAAVDLDQLVDQAGGRGAGAGHDGGAGAVRVDGLGGQGGDRVLVEVAGDDDLGLGRAQRVEQLAGVGGQHRQVAGVDAHGAQVRGRRPRSRCGCPGRCRTCRRAAWSACPAWRPARRTPPARRRAAG